MFKFKQTIRLVDFITTAMIWLGFKNIKYNKVNVYSMSINYNIGDRIGQLIILPYPTIEFEESEELSKTERGANGYGHTGK